MGSGKTTLGEAIAHLKNIPFIDLDSHIAESEKLSVQEIFSSKGEIYFRKKETLYLKELLQKEEDFILSLGGGTPCFGNNMALIKEATSLSIYLKYPPKTLAKRLIKEKPHRPLLSEINDADLEDFIRKHLFERNPFYMQANYIISMDNLTEEESINEIVKILQL